MGWEASVIVQVGREERGRGAERGREKERRKERGRGRMGNSGATSDHARPYSRASPQSHTYLRKWQLGSPASYFLMSLILYFVLWHLNTQLSQAGIR